MKIVFKNGFTMNNKELAKKTLDELYDIHSDLVNSYNHHNDKGVLDKLESYIQCRVLEEQLTNVI